MRSQANAYGAPDVDDNSRGAQLAAKFNQRYQFYLDKSVPHLQQRWAAWGGVALIYLIRISFLKGWYIVTYGLGIYNLNLIIGFLSPQVDPETQGPTLPTKGNEEFKPFVRRLPEFKFWHRSIRSFVYAFFMTFFSVFDVPGVLAHPARVLVHAVLHDHEAADQAHDQAQVSAVLRGEEAVREEKREFGGDGRREGAREGFQMNKRFSQHRAHDARDS
jgi:hypothetical protein